MPRTLTEAAPLHYRLQACAVGLALLAADDQGIHALLLGDDRLALEAELRQRFPRRRLEADDGRLAGCLQAVRRRLADPCAPLAMPLAPAGTPFQLRVWQALGEIPPGHTLSYGVLAARLGSHPRAVARACASNPVAILIPCHRVVNSRGQLAGYRWGLARKAQLLAAERAAPTTGA